MNAEESTACAVGGFLLFHARHQWSLHKQAWTCRLAAHMVFNQLLLDSYHQLKIPNAGLKIETDCSMADCLPFLNVQQDAKAFCIFLPYILMPMSDSLLYDV